MLASEFLRRGLQPVTPRLGAMFLVGGGLAANVYALLPGPEEMNRAGLVAVGSAVLALGRFAWFLPWERWPWWANLCLLPWPPRSYRSAT